MDIGRGIGRSEFVSDGRSTEVCVCLIDARVLF